MGIDSVVLYLLSLVIVRIFQVIAVAPWLVHSSPDRRAVRVRALVGDIVLCQDNLLVVFLARHFTLTLPLSTQVYKWVVANLMLGVTLRWTNIQSRGECKYS